VDRVHCRVATAGAINIHAAQNDSTARDAAKCVHQLPGLSRGTEDDVDDYLRLEVAQRGRIFPQEVAVASDGPHVAGERYRGLPAMEDGDFMPAVHKAADHMRADEPLPPIKSIRMEMEKSVFLPTDIPSTGKLPSVHLSSAIRTLARDAVPGPAKTDPDRPIAHRFGTGGPVRE